MLHNYEEACIQLKLIYVLFSPTAAGSPTSLNATQVNLTSFSVSWTPPTTVTGYQVYWSGDRGYDSGNMSVGADDRAVTITGRTTGLTYNITLLALSDHLPSAAVGTVVVTLGEVHAGSVCYIKSLYAQSFLQRLWKTLENCGGGGGGWKELMTCTCQA